MPPRASLPIRERSLPVAERASCPSPHRYIACMNPTAGSFMVDPRLQRLFVTLAVETPGSDSLMQIFGGTRLHSWESGSAQQPQTKRTSAAQGQAHASFSLAACFDLPPPTSFPLQAHSYTVTSKSSATR